MGGIVLRAQYLVHHILLTEATEANHLRVDMFRVVTHLVRTEEGLILADHNQEQEQEENIFIPIRL